MGLDEKEIDRRVRAAAAFAGLEEELLEKSPFDDTQGVQRYIEAVLTQAVEQLHRMRRGQADGATDKTRPSAAAR